jgi:hypothetical protein
VGPRSNIFDFQNYLPAAPRSVFAHFGHLHWQGLLFVSRDTGIECCTHGISSMAKTLENRRLGGRMGARAGTYHLGMAINIS